MTQRDIRDIVDSALGSLDNAQITQGLVGTNLLINGRCVVTIVPTRGQLLIQAIEGLGVQPRKHHLIRQRSREAGWEIWVTATTTGLASFVHQAAPALGSIAASRETDAPPANMLVPPQSKSPRTIPGPDIEEDVFISSIGKLTPGDAEAISIAWQVNDLGLRDARARSLAAASPRWPEAKARFLLALESRLAVLGDDLPWDDVRAAGLDALRAVLAGERLARADRDVLTRAWPVVGGTS